MMLAQFCRRACAAVGVAIVLSGALGACSEAPAPLRSVQFFKDHPDERRTTMERCKQLTQASEDCENAATANLIEAQREPVPKPKFPTKAAD